MLDTKINDTLSSWHEQNEKKRCPLCLGLNTKKKGHYTATQRTRRGCVMRRLQRFYCLDCRHSFNDQGYSVRKSISEDVKQHAVHDYALTKNSLSEVALRYKVSRSSIITWMNHLAQRIPDDQILPEITQPGGTIMIDGKELKIGKERYSLLVAFDDTCGLPVHYRLYKDENSESTRHFLAEVKKKYPVPVLGVISDFGKGKCFMKVVGNIFPNVPHQVCLVHFWRYVTFFIPKSKSSIYADQNTILKQWIWNVIHASDKDDSMYWLNRIKQEQETFQARYHKWFIKSVIYNYEHLTQHYSYPFLKKNNNPLENLNKQLNRKLKNLDSFKSINSAKSFLKLWFLNYFITKTDPI